ncbi:MAG: tetratricopeptide repeat protein, partial [Limisphaerales bacterium]
MAVSWRWIVWLAALLAASSPALAANTPEETAFKSASTAFNETIWDRAEAEFASFIHTYTNSARLPQAVLYQAEARFKQKNFAGAIEVLISSLAKAGKWGDEYLFWTGEAYLQKSDFRAADDAFLKLSADFPNSPRRLEAAVEQAGARAQLEQWPQVIELLEQTNGVFQTSISKGVVNDHIVNGYLLLAKAHLQQRQAPAAEVVLASLSKIPLSATDDWQRLHLLGRVQVLDGKPDEALVTATNLMSVAVSTGQPKLRADSIALQAAVLEALNRLPQAIAMYTNNLAAGTPPDRQREALLKVVELSLKENAIPEAAHTLEQYLNQFTNAPAEDLAWLTLGELRLRQCIAENQTELVAGSLTNSLAATNCLEQALAALKKVLAMVPQSSLFGRAQLDLGWCFWFSGQTNESRAAFQSAVEHLQGAPDQAVAYFKLADVQFQQTNFLGAITNYSAVVDKFTNRPEIETNLFEPALYQIVRAGLAAGRLTDASNAVAKILAWYPDGFYADRAV